MSVTNRCPVCGKSELEEYEICEFCKWENDFQQLEHPDRKGCANRMSLNEAKEAYKAGKPVL